MDCLLVVKGATKSDPPKVRKRANAPTELHLFDPPHHSVGRVKAIRRPKKTTKTQQAIEIPPASRTGRGVEPIFHSFTPRTVLNSKIIMLMPASTMSNILTQNTQLPKYSVGLLMSRSEPAITETTKATQVNGRT